MIRDPAKKELSQPFVYRWRKTDGPPAVSEVFTLNSWGSFTNQICSLGTDLQLSHFALRDLLVSGKGPPILSHGGDVLHLGNTGSTRVCHLARALTYFEEFLVNPLWCLMVSFLQNIVEAV